MNSFSAKALNMELTRKIKRLLVYIKFQTKFSKSLLLELTRMIRETLIIRRNLIDLLPLDSKTVFKIKRVENPQMSFW